MPLKPQGRMWKSSRFPQES